MKKKEIRFLRDVGKSGMLFQKDSRFTVSILKIDVNGYMERYGSDSTMEGYFEFCALCEFENGKIMSFFIDDEIHVVGDAE